MEIKLFAESPLDEFSVVERRRSATPGAFRTSGPGGGLNSRQMFSSALRRTDISPLTSSSLQGSEVEGGKRSVEASLLESTSHHRSYTQASEPTPYASLWLSSSAHFQDVTNTPKDTYKVLYERAVARHAEDKQRWNLERQQLLERLQRLEGVPAVRDTPTHYLQRINQEIEDLKARLRSTDQQNSMIRARSRAKAS